MTVYRPLIYKIATEPREFEMIHALNYRTFVEEIPQHAVNGTRKLIDRFHAENTYVICLAGNDLVGMVALRGKRPFSLDEKVPALQSYLPADRKPCEIRLLAVESSYRKTSIFAGLVLRLLQIARGKGYDLALISGTTRQLKLYRHLGFEPFGPFVGKPEAVYQPMMLTLERFESCLAWLAEQRADGVECISFLPGPVEISEEVQRTFAGRPLSHRGDQFGALLRNVQAKLQALTSADHVAVMVGSGTLANDVVAGQLSSRKGKGLILSNGEFGERLIDHARRWRIDFDTYQNQWGKPFDLDDISSRLDKRPSWLWFAHCETSTGMLNDIATIRSLCETAGVELCVDAISSIGTVEVELRGVEFATAVSGKGLGSFPGLAIVFHRHRARQIGSLLPRYLDLELYSKDHATPFTHSSNLLAALAVALKRIGKTRYETLRQDSKLLRVKLAEAGLECVAPAAYASPGIVTIALPQQTSSREVAARVGASGYSVAYNSKYLLERGWIQIALMGEYSRAGLMKLVESLKDATQLSARNAGRDRPLAASNL